MSLPVIQSANFCPGFPRVSGDEPPWFTERGYEFVFSPRERG